MVISFIKSAKIIHAIINPTFLILSFVLAGCDYLGESIRHPDMLFLGWDEKGQTMLYQVNNGKTIKQLTLGEGEVIDYDVSMDGKFIAYIFAEENDTNSIWKMELNGGKQSKLFDCLKFSCSEPVWSPEGDRLIFEKSEIGGDGISGVSKLWWLDAETGESWPVLEDSQAHGKTVGFSPDGGWVSYFSPEDESIYIYNLEDGRSTFFPSEVGMPAAWSPAGDQVILPNLDLVIIHGDDGDDHLDHTHDFQSATHLFLADIETGSIEAVSGDLNVEDTVASWSPDGQWIAFGRRPARTGAGRQLWLMKPDGTDARPLTADLDLNYGPPQWSPDGRFILFQRFSLLEPEKEPGIWLLDIDSGEQIEVVESGMQPQWIDSTNR